MNAGGKYAFAAGISFVKMSCAANILSKKLILLCINFPMTYQRIDNSEATDAVCIKTQIPPIERKTENRINSIAGFPIEVKLQQPFDSSSSP